MAVIMQGIVDLYHYLNEDIVDQRTNNWPLMRTPWPGLAILGLYLVSVLKWLPDFMEKRPAYNLRKTIAFYNAVQIVACSYVVYQSLRLEWLNNYALVCQPVDKEVSGIEVAWKVCYAYFIIKMIDLLDTVFFILRKKQNQVSFLHVYHHCGVVMVAWSVVKYLPGGHVTMVLLLNSIVHIVMYSYYLLTVWDETYKQSIWWKKYVTQIQIIQFVILLFHLTSLVIMPDCAFPRQPAYILIPQDLFMIFLFTDFYIRTYIMSKKRNDINSKKVE